jgi:ElaB/YqjD/DUF883 family membrane-anchored ribosome-binding protein
MHSDDPRHDLEEALARARSALERLSAALPEAGGDARRRVAALVQEIEKTVAENETLNAARDEVGGAVRRHPLAALGLAFGAGLALALLLRS